MKLCKLLNYTRSLSPSKAAFFYKTKDCDFKPLQTELGKYSGQKASHSDAYSGNGEVKNVAPQDLAYANIQTLDCCYVPPDVNEIFCRFSLIAKANSLEPEICSDAKVRRWLSLFAQNYKSAGGYDELARRYCKNILLGTWLWRNQRSVPTSIEVLTSNGNVYLVENVNDLDWRANWPEQNQAILDGLVAEMAAALSDPKQFWHVNITAKLQTTFMQEIYPSQEFEIEKTDDSPSRLYATALCENGERTACFHSFKIGAAIQMIDDWWGSEDNYPLRVHEYGADKRNCIAQRHPVFKKDFYYLIQFLAVYIRQLRNCAAIPPEIHYVMAVLIKGGVFPHGSKKS